MYILIMKTSAKIILIVVIVAVALGVWWWVAYQQNGNTSGAGSYAPIATTPTTTPTPRASSRTGLAVFVPSPRIGCTHAAVNATKADDHGEKLACFRWVNTILGNVKTAIVGTLKSVAKRYVFRYLAEFQYRFNRRSDLSVMLDRLACVATRAAPRPCKSLKITLAAG